MKHTAVKRLRMLCGMVAMLVLVSGIASVPAFALPNGIYVATATPHYRHPGTGKIEDSGGEGSAVLGQSMTESATHTRALVEVDSNGNTYITVRLKLMDNIENPKWQVDGARNGSFQDVTATVMQEDFTENTTDFRMQVPNENAVIRCTMYVIPMGRWVIFYITVSDLTSGSEDFVTSVQLETPVTTDPPATNPPVTDPPATAPLVTDFPATNPPDTAKPAETTVPDTAEPDTISPDISQPEIETNSSGKSADNKATGLEEFDASGKKVEDTKNTTDNKKDGSSTAGWIVAGVIVVLLAGAAVWYFCFFRKKSKNK